MASFLLIRRLLPLFAISPVSAQDPCVAVPGGCAPVNVLLNFVQALGELLVNVAAGAAVLFVVWGGMQMIVNFGDEGKMTQGKNSVIYALIGFGLVLASQSIVAFVQVQAAPIGASLNPLITAMAVAVDTMYKLFNVAFVIFVMYAGIRMVIGRGDQTAFTQARTMLIWVLGGALVINVAHALVYAVLGLGF